MANKFSDKYQDEVFYLWYDNNRPGMNKLYDIVHPELERKPSLVTLQNWYKDFGWEQRADALDGEASQSLDQKVIQRRVEMWEKLEKVGGMLVDKGEEFLEERGIDKADTAIRAITDGADLLRASVGQAESWFKISKMTDVQLDNAFKSLLNKGKDDVEYSSNDIIDAITNDLDNNEQNISEEPQNE